MVAPLPYHRFTVGDYERMGETGILGEDERVELIYGEILEMEPIGDRHIACLGRVDRACHRQLGDEVVILVGCPFRLLPDSEPQPDLMLVRSRDDQDQQPTASDVLIVLEVAEGSLVFDRTIKLPLYAEARIPEAWLLDLVANRIERHTNPRRGRYRTVAFADPGESLASTVLPNVVFDARDVLDLRKPAP